jgi:hypothetical protein
MGRGDGGRRNEAMEEAARHALRALINELGRPNAPIGIGSPPERPPRP